MRPRTQIAAPALWALSDPPTLAAAARASGAVDLYTLPHGSRVPGTGLRLDGTHGAPSALALSSSPTSAVVGTGNGAVLLDESHVTTLPSGGPVSAAAYVHGTVLAVGGGAANDAVLIDSVRRSVKASFSAATQHAAPVSHALLRVTPGGQLHAVLASQAVTQHDVTSGSGVVIRRFAGHVDPVSAAALLGGHALTATDRAPHISVWPLADSDNAADRANEDENRDDATLRRKKKKRKSRNSMRHDQPVPAAATLVAPAAGVKQLAADEASGCVAALLHNGNVAIWRDLTEHPALVVRRGPRSGEVLAVAFAKRGTLSVLHGTPLRPTVFSVRAEDDNMDVDEPHPQNGRTWKEIELPAAHDELLVRGDSGDREAGAEALADARRRSQKATVSHVAPAANPPQKKKKNGVMQSDAVEKVNGKEQAFETEDDDDEEEEGEGEGEDDENEEEEDDEEKEGDDEPSLQDKLASLELKGVQPQHRKEQAAPLALEPTNMSSRVSVLRQAIQSHDTTLLDTCLNTHDLDVIRATVCRVSPYPLLDLLVHRLRARPAHTRALVAWVRAVLTEHAASIITQERDGALAALSAFIEEKTSTLAPLARLHGRLEFVVAQAERTSGLSTRGFADAYPDREYEEEDRESEGEEESSSDSDSASASDNGSDNGSDSGSDSDSDEEEEGEEEGSKDEESDDATDGEDQEGDSGSGEGDVEMVAARPDKAVANGKMADSDSDSDSDDDSD